MLKNNLNYPYPMLRNSCVDYQTSVLISEIDLEATVDKYIISSNISTTNKEINQLLQEGKVKKGIFVEAKSLWFRKFYDLTDNAVLEISTKELYGHVTLTPCIVSIEYIDDFYSQDFCKEFLLMKKSKIHINKGEIVAIGEDYGFDAYFEKDIFRNVANIFQFNISNKKNVEYDLSNDVIAISLPRVLYHKYFTISRGFSRINAILNSVLIFPILVSTLHDLNSNYDSYVDKKWFLTIKKSLENNNIFMSNSDIPIDDPIICAQMLTNDLLLETMETLEFLVSNGEGE